MKKSSRIDRESQNEINTFINIIQEDLMEIYGISNEEATFFIENFQLRKIIDSHGEIISHYPTQELAKMIYEQKQVGELMNNDIKPK